MSDQGWVKLHRQLFKNPLSRKPNYLAVWSYILSFANYENTEIIWNNEKKFIKRGSFITSISKIAEFFNLSTGTVSYILEYLCVEKQIEKESTMSFTVITVLNYDQYQEVEKKVENELKTSKKRVETTKNIKNIKNEKNKEILEEIQSFLSFWNQTYNTKHRAVEPLLNNFTYWREIYTLEEMQTAVKNLKQDKFWSEIMNPGMFLRRKNPRKEEVDYIGNFLNLKGTLLVRPHLEY